MTPPDNEQTADNQARDSEHEKTVILMRCEKHELAYMANEGCPECEKEKSSAGA